MKVTVTPVKRTAMQYTLLRVLVTVLQLSVGLLTPKVQKAMQSICAFCWAWNTIILQAIFSKFW